MFMPKFDVFVCSPRRASFAISKVAEPITVKLYALLQQRLTSQGFGNVIHNHDSEYTHDLTSTTLTTDECGLLLKHPFFISEHQMAKPINLEQHVSKVVHRIRNIPYRIRPSLDAYQFCDRGRVPMFHIIFAGPFNVGKTYVMNEFKLMLKELVPDVEIVVCDNGIHNHENWDITTDPVAYEEYRKRVLSSGISIGQGPTVRVGIDDSVHHNTKF